MAVVDEREAVIGEIRQHVAPLDRSRPRRRLEPAGGDEVADGEHSRLGRQRDRAFAAQLEPVVLLWIVRRGDHDAGRIAEFADGEIQLVGARQPEVDDVRSLGRDASRERVEERLRGRAHVAPDGDGRRMEILHERAPDQFGDRFVQLVGERSADVVALEDAEIDVRLHAHLASWAGKKYLR